MRENNGEWMVILEGKNHFERKWGAYRLKSIDRAIIPLLLT